MKETLRIVSILGILSLVPIASCKKESIVDTPDRVETITGTWNGTYGDPIGNGSIIFNLKQVDTVVTGSYSSTSSGGVTGGGSVTGTLSGKKFQAQTLATIGSCTIVTSISGNYSGFAIGATLSASYSGNNSCSGSWTGGVLSLTKQ